MTLRLNLSKAKRYEFNRIDRGEACSPQAYYGQARERQQDQPKEQTMKRYLCHYIVEAGPVMGVRQHSMKTTVEIAVDLGGGKHEIIEVPDHLVDEDDVNVGDYLLRGVKGQIQIMTKEEFVQAHAELSPESPGAKSFRVQEE